MPPARLLSAPCRARPTATPAEARSDYLGHRHAQNADYRDDQNDVQQPLDKVQDKPGHGLVQLLEALELAKELHDVLDQEESDERDDDRQHDAAAGACEHFLDFFHNAASCVVGMEESFDGSIIQRKHGARQAFSGCPTAERIPYFEEKAQSWIKRCTGIVFCFRLPLRPARPY